MTQCNCKEPQSLDLVGAFNNVMGAIDDVVDGKGTVGVIVSPNAAIMRAVCLAPPLQPVRAMLNKFHRDHRTVLNVALAGGLVSPAPIPLMFEAVNAFDHYIRQCSMADALSATFCARVAIFEPFAKACRMAAPLVGVAAPPFGILLEFYAAFFGGFAVVFKPVCDRRLPTAAEGRAALQDMTQALAMLQKMDTNGDYGDLWGLLGKLGVLAQSGKVSGGNVQKAIAEEGGDIANGAKGAADEATTKAAMAIGAGLLAVFALSTL